MKGKITTLVCGAVLSIGFSAAEGLAEGPRPINQRQHRQHQRIREGIRSDELTRLETIRLGAEQAQIRALERRARRDGELERSERIRLQRELNQASRHIYRQKHDRQDRD